jgi:hypothetical protein
MKRKALTCENTTEWREWRDSMFTLCPGAGSVHTGNVPLAPLDDYQPDPRRRPVTRRRPTNATNACPDCTARLDRTDALRHDTSCPVGLDTDATSAADRAWFAAHPFVAEYRRELTYSERATLPIAFGMPTPAVLGGRVHVTRLPEGMRMRRYNVTHFVIDVDPQRGAA